MKAVQPMKRDEVLLLAQEQTTTNVETLARAIGSGRQVLYTEIKNGTWRGTRVLRVGRLIKIPTADILALIDGKSAPAA